MFDIEDDIRKAKDEKRRKKYIKDKEANATASSSTTSATTSVNDEVQLRDKTKRKAGNTNAQSQQYRMSKSVVDVIGQKVSTLQPLLCL
jgi:hypothetical protein